MTNYILTVEFTEDEDSEFPIEYLEEAIEQAGGFVSSIKEN